MKYLLLIILILIQACASSEKLSVSLDKQSEAYLSFPDYGRVSLSREGSYVAVTSIIKDRRVVSILSRKDMKVLASMPLEENMKVQNFIWVNDKRLIIQVVVSEGYLKGSGSEQFIFAIDYDGKNKKQLYPQRTSLGESVNFSVSFFNLVSDDIVDDRYLLVSENKYMARNAYYDLKLLDINTGRTKPYDRVKMRFGNYGVDNLKQARVAYKVDKKLKTTFYTKNLVTKKWKKNNFWSDKSREINILGFDKTNSRFYFLGDNKKTLKALFSASLSKTGEVSNIKEIFSYPHGDILNASWDKDDFKVLFVEYGDGRPKRKYFSKSKLSKLLQSLDLAFPGERVYLGRKRGGESLVMVLGDKRPITYYTYNYQKKNVEEILSANEKVRPYRKVSSKVIEYKTRDGLTVRGYYYKAPGKNISPLVMYIHGGPYGASDRWGYDGDIQFMVSKGFSVMQVNYRGSGGRGRAFEEKGYRKLGTSMQEDLADAALWAIKNKYAQKGKICLWGISYGAYASMMSIHKYPDLFECAVGFGGVYDWRTILGEGDSAKNEYAQSAWGKQMPESEEEQFKQSPVSLAKDLKKDVYIMHGREDVRCTVFQARRLKSALDEQGKKFEYREYPGIGHWFTAKNQGKKNHAYNEIVSFFESKIK